MHNDSPTLELTKQLISRQSVTPEDDGCQTIMTDRLSKIGFDIQPLRFEDVDNFWAIRGESGPILCFAGHTDVVPSGPESSWQSPPFEPTVKDGVLVGRGAADMKGSLAAMVVAVENYVAKNPNDSGRIAFLITSDEEGIAANGTVKVVDWLKQQNIIPEYCLVGEPSSSEKCGDTIKNGRRGSLGCKLRVLGKQGHVAYPHLADNPIHNVAPALAELANYEWDRGNDFFPATSFQISNINAGTGVENVVPGQLDLVFNLRFSSELTPEEIKRRVTHIIDQHSDEYELTWQVSGLPFLTKKGTLTTAVEKALLEVTDNKPILSTGGGTSDGRFIAPTGAQLIELGPINATIHKVNECVNVDELDLLSLTYSKVLENILL